MQQLRLMPYQSGMIKFLYLFFPLSFSFLFCIYYYKSFGIKVILEGVEIKVIPTGQTISKFCGTIGIIIIKVIVTSYIINNALSRPRTLKLKLIEYLLY